MRSFLRVTALLAAVVAVPGQAWAIGEIFKVETSGTEGCGDFDFTRFSSRTNVDIYVRVVAADRWDVSFSPLFDTVIEVIGVTFFVKDRKIAFSGAQFFDDGSYIALQGTATLDANGFMKRASGTFIQDSTVFQGCFSSGKWKTTQRLN